MTNDLQRYLGTGETPTPGRPLATLRGVDLMPQDEAIELTRELYAHDESSCPLGTLLLPLKALQHHLMMMGSPGVGKSSLINQVLRDSLEKMRQGMGLRLFIWDLKGTMRRHLEPYRNDLRIDYVNPFYEHGVGIDFADVETTAAADQLAEDMVSPRADAGKSANMEWVEAARGIFAEVVKIFQKRAPGRWKFSDLVEAMSTRENLKRVLSLSSAGRSKLRGILGTDKQAMGVLFNLQGSLRSMRTLAAAMNHSTNISLREWAQGPPSVLVLQHHHKYEKALAGFERWVFGRMVDLAIDGAESSEQTTLFYLDEVRHGPFESHLMKLATVGRGQGVGIVMGLTDVSGLNDQLNDDQAEEVLGSFSTQVLFRNNNPGTAGWASERLGSQTALMPETSASVTLPAEGAEAAYQASLDKYFKSSEKPVNHGMFVGHEPGKERLQYQQHKIVPAAFNAERPTPKSHTLNIALKETERPLATRSEVMNLPLAQVVGEKGLVVPAYVVSAFIGKPTLMVVSEMDHPDVTLLPAAKHELPNVERPAAQFDFDGWDEDDEERLGLPEPPRPGDSPERRGKRSQGRERRR
jgi:hypothetical protein